MTTTPDGTQAAARYALDRLTTLTESRNHLDELIAERVRDARDNGASWQDIADTLGVTRQSAWQRFRDVTD